MNRISLILVTLCLAAAQQACSPTVQNDPIPGPDKQGMGLLTGAMLGAGSGAVVGAQVGSVAGPGALVGAGVGAVYGSIKGIGTDILEEDQIKREKELALARERLWAQEQLAEHYQRRLELHPSRDIFPADLFFEADGASVSEYSVALVREIAELSRERLPSSRILVVSYLTSSDPESAFARQLTEERAENIALEFVRSGINPRRMLTQGVILTKPLLIDPYDNRDRYRQALEIVLLDK